MILHDSLKCESDSAAPLTLRQGCFSYMCGTDETACIFRTVVVQSGCIRHFFSGDCNPHAMDSVISIEPLMRRFEIPESAKN